MLYICNKCDERCKTKVNFRVAKEDAVGFVVLCIVLLAPVGFIAWIWTMIEMGDGAIFKNAMVMVVFIFTFYKIARRVYSFFSLFVDFNFSLKMYCNKCGETFKSIIIPADKNV